MRRMLSIHATLLFIGFGCVTPALPPPRAQTAATVLTPASALLQTVDAVAAGDERAFRVATDLSATGEGGDTFVQWYFAGNRLRRTAVERGIASEPIRSADHWDRNRSITPEAAMPDAEAAINAIRHRVKSARWIVEGDIARMADRPHRVAMTRVLWFDVVRRPSGWTVVAGSLEPIERLAATVPRAAAEVRAVNAATDAIRAGQLTTVTAINDFIDFQRAEPASN